MSSVEAASSLQSVIKEFTFGSQYIVGTLVAKSMTSFVGGFGGGDIVTSQTLQSLDVLVVQANTNVLSPP